MKDVLFMNVGSDIESAQPVGAMDSSQVRIASHRQIAILTYIAIKMIKRANMRNNKAKCVHQVTNVAWVLSANLTAKIAMEDVRNTFLQLMRLVCFHPNIIRYIAVYGKLPQDLFVCKEGFGALDSNFNANF